MVGRVPRDEDVVHVEVGEGQGGRVEAAEVKRGYDVPISRYFDHISYFKKLEIYDHLKNQFEFGCKDFNLNITYFRF